MKIFKKATITAALAAMALAPVLALTPDSAAEPVAPAPASAHGKSVSSSTYQGVRMYVRNQTKTDMSVTPSQGSSQNVAPGGFAVFYGKAPGMGYDDLELSIWFKDKYVRGVWTYKKLIEVDGSNPTIGYPNINLTHLHGGGSEMKYFSVNEGKEMLDHRVWVKRFGDDGNSTKQFDIDIKRAS